MFLLVFGSVVLMKQSATLLFLAENFKETEHNQKTSSIKYEPFKIKYPSSNLKQVFLPLKKMYVFPIFLFKKTFLPYT